jgi:L-rhamnose mutarotase
MLSASFNLWDDCPDGATVRREVVRLEDATRDAYAVGGNAPASMLNKPMRSIAGRNGMMTRRLCFALDLIDDAALIAEYEALHAPGGGWPEVQEHIRARGFLSMEIWRTAARMVMIAEVAEDFPRDAPEPPETAAWEALMWRFQQPLLHAAPGEKWIPMRRIFELDPPRG